MGQFAIMFSFGKSDIFVSFVHVEVFLRYRLLNAGGRTEFPWLVCILHCIPTISLLEVLLVFVTYFLLPVRG